MGPGLGFSVETLSPIQFDLRSNPYQFLFIFYFYICMIDKNYNEYCAKSMGHQVTAANLIFII